METTVTARTAATLAAELNASYAAGQLTTVNGREVTARVSGAQVASSWQNGTVSVTVRGRSARTTGTVYVKVGQVLRTA